MNVNVMTKEAEEVWRIINERVGTLVTRQTKAWLAGARCYEVKQVEETEGAQATRGTWLVK